MKTIVARAVVACLSTMLCACATVAETPDTSRLGFTDLTGQFAAAYETAPQDNAARLEALGGAFADDLPGFYDPARFGEDADAYRRMAGRFLAAYPARRGEIAEVAQRFGAMFDPAVADFERRVGPLPTDTPVALVVSMGEFDGATRTLGGREYLLFGADMIAETHGGEARAFVQHELFHIYHGPRMGQCEPFYCSLWTEGLAVYAAKTLNPDATDAQLLLTLPEPIRPEVEQHRREAVCATLARLDERDSKDWGAFFSGARLNERLPPRFGYLVGLWVAQELGKTHSLDQMAQWQGPDLRARIGVAMDNMADCGSAATGASG